MNYIPGPHAELTSIVISAAIEVQSHLGPGLMENAYEECLMAELEERRILAQRQVIQPVVYKNLRLAKSYKIDIVVEKLVLLELKAVRTLTDADEAQTLTYLRLSKLEIALLLNFNAYPLKNGGIRRFLRTNPKQL